MDSDEVFNLLVEEKSWYEARQRRAVDEENSHAKIARDVAVKRFREKEILSSVDKYGKRIDRPAIVFLSTVGGGNQKVSLVS